MPDTSGDLTPYSELADTIDQLPVALLAVRRARRMSLRAVAREADVSFATVARIERGEDLPNTTTLVKILRWMDRTPEKETK